LKSLENESAAWGERPPGHPLLRIVFRALMSLTPVLLACRRRGRRIARDRPMRLGAGGLLAALALVAGGCSSGTGATNANLILGKQQFVAKCGSCHTLARADTKGIVGPNLDESFRSGVAEADGRDVIRGVVEHQVLFPNPEGVMPKELVHGAVLRDIAAYVAETAAKPGSDTGLLATAVPLPGAGKAAVEKAGKLPLEADPQGQLAYTASKATATPGPVTITMANMSGVMHNVAVEEGTGGAAPSGKAVLGASKFVTKGSASVTVTLKPGSYTFFCQAPGHRAAGMWGTLTVK
jgi:plastocyanin